ncbi:uncharacterized protein LOC143150979 [Ptiloglossa arizonensis]|uniref:uncharacterized protein LOC143150979 n=1 Tax=Ptiloglossa arizonensis TaxID=3350558 RepID=UPI003FA101DC
MLRDKVLIVFVLCAIVHGMPQSNGNVNQDATVSPPLLQFTNGGIRFNLGGYHAEAGLGGLLTGSRTGGGLHASAGTPWGANARAGLGGLLGGDNGNAGGGLYARAGLGNGRPEAAAGLGGLLDGSGRSSGPARGGLFAGATTGSRGVGVMTGNAFNGPYGAPNGGPNAGPNGGPNGGPNAGSNAGANGGLNGGLKIDDKSNGGRTNIQIIARSEKKAQKLKQVQSDSVEQPPKEENSPAHKGVREAEPPVPLASASIFGTVAVIPSTPGPLIAQAVAQAKTPENVGTIESVPPVPQLTTRVKEIVRVVDDRPQRVKVVYPKWVARKRLRGHRKQIVYESSLEGQDSTDSNAQKVSRRQTDEIVTYVPAKPKTVVVQTTNSNGFFDDVFNIPGSTLDAVNQFLNNNFG